jgi:cysteine desulfurase
VERIDGVQVTGPRGDKRLPHQASVLVPGAKADGVLLELDLRGVAASSGSACNALTGEPSHVLRALGCDRDAAEGSLCFSLGRWTTAAEIDFTLDVLPGIVERLRRLAPG